jgi:hypothetical protein
MALELATVDDVNAARAQIDETAQGVDQGIAEGFASVDSDVAFDQLVELVQALQWFIRHLLTETEPVGLFTDRLPPGEFDLCAAFLRQPRKSEALDFVERVEAYLEQRGVGWLAGRLPELTGLIDRARAILHGANLPVAETHPRAAALRRIAEDDLRGTYYVLFWQCCDARTGHCGRHGALVALVERLWRNIDRAHPEEAAQRRAGRERATLAVRFTALRNLRVQPGSGPGQVPDERYRQFLDGTW